MLYFKTRKEWRKWLMDNHLKEKEVWLVYYKKHTKIESVSYNDAVEEALCFGWIDSLVRRIDEERYMQKYTPRKPNSVWSLLNTKRVEKMIKEGKMTETGLELVNIAKKNGKWDNAYASGRTVELPDDFLKEIKNNTLAFNNFNKFSNSQKFIYINWINDSKRLETRKKRIKDVINRCYENIKPGF